MRSRTTGERDVTVDGWVYSTAGGLMMVSPDPPGGGTSATDVRGLVLSGPSPREGSRVRLRGVLAEGRLRVTEAAISGLAEGELPLLRGYEALRTKASRFLIESGRVPGDRAFETSLTSYAELLSEHPDVLTVQSLLIDGVTVYSVVAFDHESVGQAVSEAGFSGRIMLSPARWTRADIERADRIVSAVPDSALVSITGGVSAYGDTVMHLVIFDRDEELARAVATLPDGLLTVETWISEV